MLPAPRLRTPLRGSPVGGAGVRGKHNICIRLPLKCVTPAQNRGCSAGEQSPGFNEETAS